MNKKRTLLCFVTLCVLAVFTTKATAAEEYHPHHIGAVVGAGFHGGDQSGFVGLDYIYRFPNDYAMGVFYEEVRGDFDLRAVGLTFGKYFDNGFKFGMGPGMETKLKKNKDLWLFHVTLGYDWHKGNWSYGPVATIDFIEDESTTTYVGFSVGYGF